MGRPRKKRLLEPHVEKFIEGELSTHLARVKLVEWLKTCVATEALGWDQAGEPNPGAGRPAGRVGNPTLARVLAMERSDELRATEPRVKRVEGALLLLTEAERKIVTLLYLERRLTPQGAAVHMGYTVMHIYRLKERAMLQLAVAFGLADKANVQEQLSKPRKDVKKAPSTA